METALFLMGTFGIIGALLELGMSSSGSSEKRSFAIAGLIFCFLWLITGIIIILSRN